MSESVRKEGIELLVLGQLNISNLISIIPGSTFNQGAVLNLISMIPGRNFEG